MPPISFVVQMKDLSNPWTVITLLSLTGLTVLFTILTARKFVRWMNSKEDRTVIKDLKVYLENQKENKQDASFWQKVKANFEALLEINNRLMSKLNEIYQVLVEIKRQNESRPKVGVVSAPTPVPAIKGSAEKSYFGFFEQANWQRSKSKAGDVTYYVKNFATGIDDEDCEIVLITKVKTVAKSYAEENGYTHYCKYIHDEARGVKIRISED